MKKIIPIICIILFAVLVSCVGNGKSETDISNTTEETTTETADISGTANGEDETTFTENATVETAEEEEYTKLIQIVMETGTGVTGAYRLWEFKGNLNGFVSDCASVGDGYMTYTQSSGAKLASPIDTAIPTDSVRTFELRMRTETECRLGLSYDVSGNSTSPAGSVEISLIGDGNWHDYQIDLALTESWQGTVKRFYLSLGSECKVDIEYIRLTGVYVVPFPWMSGNFDRDVNMLTEIKETYTSKYNTATIGFSAIIQYLQQTDSNGNLALSGMRSVDYLVKLSKATDMPVMIWLRADPWGDVDSGIAKKLFDDGNTLMWTQELTENPVYRNDTTGFRYHSLAQKDLNGNKTDYWTYTEKLLAECSEQIANAIEENPGTILGVTTTSEYKFNTDSDTVLLDYNPMTILEFRDWSREKFGTIENFNQQSGTSFTTWELRSTDMNPATEENSGGFDAPRTPFKPTEFWDVWTEFRAYQINNAVQKLVDIIGTKLDSKYIYTHQIASNKYTLSSPIECGNASGANIGTDFFNYECTKKNCEIITEMLGGDVTRTWGIPEWLALHDTGYKQTAVVVERMTKYGIKYICPFNWGSNDSYDFKNSESEKAVCDYLDSQNATCNTVESATVSATSGFTGCDTLIDGNRNTAFTSESFKAGDWISFTFEEKIWIHTVTLVSNGDTCGMPEQVTVQYKQDGEWKTIGTVVVDKASANNVIVFDDTETDCVRIIIDQPSVDTNNKPVLSLSEITIR